MYKNQPGVVLRMKANPGMGKELFEITTKLHHTGDPDGPVNWILCRLNDDPEILWVFEFYRDNESFTRHYTNPVVDINHEKVIAILADTPLRADVHVIVSGNNTNEPAAGSKSLFKDQPGVVLRMQAKPGKGKALFELTTSLHHTGDPDGPLDWVLCQLNDDPDTLWAFEFYRHNESFARHYTNPTIDKAHENVFDLLAGMPLRADVHIVVSSSGSKD
ncbi:putative quinol monooxygenase [Pedobacter sp. L105]|uniref:putative quinol monooxygenase n=1 Tax=Pedobacter sp. L105 TaxID=1641871 RepID=UPI00131E26E2|nr:antibiotic biosynthesis monooxygenase [Pedobacter sp. L105]